MTKTQQNYQPLQNSGRLVGDSGLWLMISLDICVFSWYFAVYMATGVMANPALFEHSRQLLNPLVGYLSTIILLTSSWLVVQAVDGARRDERKKVKKYLVCAIGVASLFIVLKAVAYGELIVSGITLETNNFFRFYFAFTLIHFLHYLIGMGLLIFVYSMAGQESSSSRFLHWIESIASYWHKVDMLWIVLFTLFYLLKRAG